MRMLEKDPAARFQSYESLREALSSCQEDLARVPSDTWKSPRNLSDRERTGSKATVFLVPGAPRAPVFRGRRVAQLLAVPLLVALGVSLGFRAGTNTSDGDERAELRHSSPVEAGTAPPDVEGLTTAKDPHPIPVSQAPDPLSSAPASPPAIGFAGPRAAGRAPCGYELRGILCPFEQPYSPAVAEARARAVRSRPWRLFPEVLSGALQHLASLDESSRKQTTFSELEVELRSRVNALAYVKLAAPLGTGALQVHQELTQLCRELFGELKKDSKQATDRLNAMKARVDALPSADRELFDEVMVYGNVPDRLQKGPGMRNKGGFVELATIQTPSDPGMFEVSIRPAR